MKLLGVSCKVIQVELTKLVKLKIYFDVATSSDLVITCWAQEVPKLASSYFSANYQDIVAILGEVVGNSTSKQ